MTKNNTALSQPAECPVCDEHTVRETWETETFLFGESEEISALVPTMHCQSCGFVFTDRRAEVLRHDAVCQHQRLLTPSEITEVRKDLGMSRRDFALAFGIPRASMDRWESGKQIQNTSLDTLLRALRNKAIAARLDRRRIQHVSAEVVVKFPTLSRTPQLLDHAKARAEVFQLRACSH